VPEALALPPLLPLALPLLALPLLPLLLALPLLAPAAVTLPALSLLPPQAVSSAMMADNANILGRVASGAMVSPCGSPEYQIAARKTTCRQFAAGRCSPRGQIDSVQITHITCRRRRMQ
jgi:hypothetical protein